MNDPHAFPAEWRAMKSAEHALLVSRFDLRKHGNFKALVLHALGTLSEQDAALRFLKDDVCGLSSADLAEIAPPVMDIAVDGSIDNLVTARAVLLRYASHFLESRKTIRSTLDARLPTYLSSEDDFLYRRLAELLVTLDFPEALAKLMAACKDNRNTDIAEIYDDFLKFSTKGGAQGDAGAAEE